jgi:hypothetical protein
MKTTVEKSNNENTTHRVLSPVAVACWWNGGLGMMVGKNVGVAVDVAVGVSMGEVMGGSRVKICLPMIAVLFCN